MKLKKAAKIVWVTLILMVVISMLVFTVAPLF